MPRPEPGRADARRPRPWRRWGLALLLAGGASAALAAGEADLSALRALSPQGLAQWLTVRNLELDYGRDTVAVTEALARAEAALYEPVLFGTVKRARTERQRTVEELTSNFTAAAESLLNEQSRLLEVGVRQRLPSGAEMALSARQSERSSNILAKANTDLEVSANLVLSFKQPLLRGRGVGVTETDRRVAEIETRVAQWQYLQQLNKVVAEGLATYWQAHAAAEAQRWREELVRGADALAEDAGQRIAAGKLAPRVATELARVRTAREAEALRAAQTRDELLLRLLSSLNVAGTQLAELRLDAPVNATAPEPVAPEEALRHWPPYQVAELRRRQGELRLAFADNQRRPAVDLVMSYGQSGLFENHGAWPTARSGRYPDWYVGLNVELGAQGNRKASEQWLAQQRRVEQADTEKAAIATAFQNDLLTKQLAVDKIERELALLEREAQAQQQLLADERQRFEAGMGLLSTLLQAEQDLIESRIRRAEARARLETARLSLLLAQGRLLAAHGIQTPWPSDS